MYVPVYVEVIGWHMGKCGDIYCICTEFPGESLTYDKYLSMIKAFMAVMR